MEKNWLIYAITLRGEIVYVGATTNLKNRLKGHRKVIHKYVRGEVLEDGLTAETWEEAERKWIAHYRAQGVQLRNIALGGLTGTVHAESSKELLRDIVTGRPCTWADKIIASKKGICPNWSPEGEARVRETQFHDGTTNEAPDARKKRVSSIKAAFDNKSDAEKESFRELARAANRNWWKNATPEQKAERLRKLQAGRDRGKQKAAALRNLANTPTWKKAGKTE